MGHPDEEPAGNGGATTLEGPLDWPDATIVSGDAVDVVARLKEESEVALRSRGSLTMNRALMAAGLVDRVQVTMFPVIAGQTGLDPIFQGAADFDMELIESRTLDGHIQELIYRPTPSGRDDDRGCGDRRGSSALVQGGPPEPQKVTLRVASQP